MSLYQCENCGCVENTACGLHAARNMDLYEDDSYIDGAEKGMKLCSSCMPINYRGGEVCKKAGKWHGRFTRTFYKKGTLETNHVGNVVNKETKERPKPEDVLGIDDYDWRKNK